MSACCTLLFSEEIRRYTSSDAGWQPAKPPGYPAYAGDAGRLSSFQHGKTKRLSVEVATCDLGDVRGLTFGSHYCNTITRMRPSEWYPPPVAFFAPCTGSGGR